MASGDTKESNVTEDVSSTNNDKAADFNSRSNNHSSEFLLYLCFYIKFRSVLNSYFIKNEKLRLV